MSAAAVTSRTSHRTQSSIQQRRRKNSANAIIRHHKATMRHTDYDEEEEGCD